MKVLIASPELSPFVREGASGDAAAGLARGLRAAGVGVTIAVPDYPIFSCLRGLVRRRRRILQFTSGGLRRHAVWTEATLGRERLLLLEKPEYFDRAGVYGLVKKGDYDDNLVRFAFWAHAVRAVARACRFDIVHALDWPGALVAAAREEHDPPVTLGLDGLAFPGDFPAEQFPETGLPWEDFGRFEFYGRVNCVKAGLTSAAAVVFPGERVAHAVRSPGAGCGLEGVACSVSDRLHGILAGIDYAPWFDARPAAARPHRESMRRAWLDEAGMHPLEAPGALVVMPLALAGGRGLDLLLPIVDRLMEFPLRLVVLGRPEPFWAPSCQLAQRRHRGMFSVMPEAGEEVLRAVSAAADVVLLADTLEPSDRHLPAIMRAGAVPLAQFCPGLHEIVRDDDLFDEPGTGLVFYRHHPEALWDSFRRLLTWRRQGAWEPLTRRAAATDFSWEGAAPRYRALFQRVMDSHAA